MKKLLLYLFMALTINAATLSEEPPAAGSASEFVINFFKATPNMTLEQAKTYFTKNANHTISQRSLDDLKKIDWSKEFKYKAIQKDNGIFLVYTRYTYGNSSTSHSRTVKKINGEWKFADDSID